MSVIRQIASVADKCSKAGGRRANAVMQGGIDFGGALA